MGIVGEELLDGTEDMISWLLLSELIFICLHIINLSSGVIVQKILAEQALLANGWASDVMVEVNTRGQIDRVLDAVSEAEQKTATHRVGILLPAPVNVHSHAFQRAMAGLDRVSRP